VGIAAAKRLTPERLSLYLVALAGLIALWNTSTYPAGAGYDAASHQEYGDFLINHLRLPHANETPEYYSPPLYYILAGSVTWVGRQAGLGDPHKLGMKLWVNDVIKQDSNSGHMIFNTNEQIAQLSSRITLHPGDVILTGTPAGVGAARKEFLKAGDTVKLWIEKIGTLTNKMA